MKNKGAVSVLLCVILISIIIVLGAAFDASSLSVANAYAKRINYLSAKSVLAEYDRNLFDDYGLMAYNLCSGDVEEKIKDYSSKMKRIQKIPGDEIVFFDLDAEKIKVDFEGRNLGNSDIFMDCLKEDIKYKVAENGAERLKDLISGKQDFRGKLTSAKKGLAEEKKQAEENAKARAEEKDKESENGNTESTETEEKTGREPLDLKRDSFNSEDNSEDRVLRSKRIIDSLPSGTKNDEVIKKTYGFGKEEEVMKLGQDSSDYMEKLYSGVNIGADKLIVMEYIKLYMKNAVDSDRFKKATFFTNETEYIIKGNFSDSKNRASVRNDLFLLRTGLNIVYIYSDSEKRQEALEVAAATGAGPYSAAVQFLIISAWAGAEAKEDINLLFDGKKVPFMKTDKTWKLDIDSIFSGGGTSGKEISGDEGMEYRDYLQVLLMSCNSNDIRERVKDIIQINMKGRYNIQFDLRNCITGFSVETDYNRISYMPSVLPGIIEDNIMKIKGEFAY